MNTKFGEYSFSVVPTDSGFIYIRKYILHQGRYHNKDYEEFYNFTLAVSKADKTKLMLSTK